MKSNVTVQRPVKVSLVVRAETGEEWPATDDDMLRATLASADKGGPLIYDNNNDFEHVLLAPMTSHLQRAQAFLDMPREEE